MSVRPICLLWLAVLAGCATPVPEPPGISVQLQASARINPDATGQPAPVEVRLYALKSRERFEQATFYPLFRQPQQSLGDSVTALTQLYIKPGETLRLTAQWPAGSRYLGVQAGFMDIEHSQWQALAELTANQPLGLNIALDAKTVAVAPQAPGLLHRLIAPVWTVLRDQATASISASPPGAPR